MGIRKNKLNHDKNLTEVRKLLLDMGFQAIPDNPHRFVAEVLDYREVKVGVTTNSLIFYIYEPDEHVTETHFEYLIYVGTVAGIVQERLANLTTSTCEEKGDVEDADETLAAGLVE